MPRMAIRLLWSCGVGRRAPTGGELFGVELKLSASVICLLTLVPIVSSILDSRIVCLFSRATRGCCGIDLAHHGSQNIVWVLFIHT
jgi:hypothetical protein